MKLVERLEKLNEMVGVQEIESLVKRSVTMERRVTAIHDDLNLALRRAFNEAEKAMADL
jgi:hypothetical protein